MRKSTWMVAFSLVLALSSLAPAQIVMIGSQGSQQQPRQRQKLDVTEHVKQVLASPDSTKEDLVKVCIDLLVTNQKLVAEHKALQAQAELLAVSQVAKTKEEILEAVVELTNDKARLEAEVEASQAKEEVMESAFELAIEKAKIEGQLETLADRDEFYGEIVEVMEAKARLEGILEAQTKPAVAVAKKATDYPKTTVTHPQYRAPAQSPKPTTTRPQYPHYTRDHVTFFQATPHKCAVPCQQCEQSATASETETMAKRIQKLEEELAKAQKMLKQDNPYANSTAYAQPLPRQASSMPAQYAQSVAVYGNPHLPAQAAYAVPSTHTYQPASSVRGGYNPGYQPGYTPATTAPTSQYKTPSYQPSKSTPSASPAAVPARPITAPVAIPERIISEEGKPPVQPNGRPVTPKTPLKKGQAIQIRAGKQWWDGKVVEATTGNSRVKIHYVGWSDQWDEFVERGNLLIPKSQK